MHRAGIIRHACVAAREYADQRRNVSVTNQIDDPAVIGQSVPKLGQSGFYRTTYWPVVRTANKHNRSAQFHHRPSRDLGEPHRQPLLGVPMSRTRSHYHNRLTRGDLVPLEKPRRTSPLRVCHNEVANIALYRNLKFPQQRTIII